MPGGKNRYGFVLWVALFFCHAATYGQSRREVLTWDARNSLYSYLMLHLHTEYDAREMTLKKALQSASSLESYRERSRKRYLQLLGALPDRSALHPVITGVLQEEGYSIKKLIYQSFPHHHVTANLYVPSGKGPFPAVLFFCGHEMPAKATLSYQQTAILFARNGFVVLVIDPVSQGERIQLTGDTGQPLTRGNTTEHTLLNAGANLVGTSVAAYQLWDNERGLDYLCSLPEVDTTHIGCLGNSGGGTQAAYFMAYDPRIKVAASCSYISRRTRRIEAQGPQDGCQWLPFEGQQQLDIADDIIMFAPKPALILAGRYDFVDYYGTQLVYRELKKVYQVFGQSLKIKLFTYDDGHGISMPKREAAVCWFRCWMYGDTTAVREGALVKTLTEKELNCTPSGQVKTTYPDEVTVQANDLSIAGKWAAQRAKLLKQGNLPEYRRVIRKLLHLSPAANIKLDTEQTGSFSRNGYYFKQFILRRKAELPLPCMVAYPSRHPASRTLVIWLNDGGMNQIAGNDSLMDSYAKKGDALLLADLRGTGETADDPRFNNKKYFNRTYRDAVLGLFTGQPLPAERVEDIFTLLSYVKTDVRLKHLQIEIDASGAAAVPALHAAVLDSSIRHLRLYHSISSYLGLLENPLTKDQYDIIIPGVLKYYDLPDLVTLLGSDKVKYIK